MFVGLPVFTIGAPLGEVGGGVGGVTIGVGESQVTEVVLVLQPVDRLVKLSNLLFTQPLKAIAATIKANPLSLRIALSHTALKVQIARIPLILR
ncbi:MAG: hypothetical protein M3O03_15140 [Pseudomonadota bacterium]|nr:hypothetical protein [Pseudomonadota bacterium]